jgi:hypothetical protein
MKSVKNPKWTWKTDLRYYCYQLPLELFKSIIAMARKDHILNEMGIYEYLDLACGIADMKCGRWWSEKEHE